MREKFCEKVNSRRERENSVRASEFCVGKNSVKEDFHEREKSEKEKIL